MELDELESDALELVVSESAAVLEVGWGPVLVGTDVVELPAVLVVPVDETGLVVAAAVVTPPEDDELPEPVGSSKSGLLC